MNQPLEDAKYRIAKEMYVDTADDNYLVARWCRFQQFNTDFSWLAVHALEKYMKAALLINGYSSKPYSHNIADIYADLKAKVAKGLLDKPFTKPAEWNRGWHDMTPEKYLERLYRAGNAENRYDVYGYQLEPEDLVRLDATVFAVRRLCQALERETAPGVTNRQVLEKQPSYWTNVGSKLEKAARRKNDPMRDILCCLNLSFAPPSYVQPNGTSGASAKQSALFKEIFRYEYGTRESVDHLAALVKWIDANIKLSPEARKQLQTKVEDERKTLKKRKKKKPSAP